MRTILLTSAAMLCFAANSIFCRLALAPKLIDPATFTSLRVLSAVAMLAVAVFLRSRRLPHFGHARPRSITALFAYLVFFSFAYTRLSAATGALVLIAAVQLTMFCVAWREGERFALLSWLGLGIACFGVAFLLLPGASAPDPLGASLMALSGAAWGFFSLFARGTDHPLEVNCINLLWCLPPALLLNVLFVDDFAGSSSGIVLAIASGALATGLGYIIWYLALRDLSAAQAATVQLSMPAIVAVAGVAFLAEPLSLRLVVAAAAMLGGIALVLARRSSNRRGPKRVSL